MANCDKNANLTIDQEVERKYQCSTWSNRSSDNNEVLQMFYKSAQLAYNTVQQTCSCETIAYGKSSREFVNVYGKENISKGGPVVVFIHGGYWQEAGVEDYLQIVPRYVEAGCCVIMLEYDLAPKVSLPEIISQTVSATRCIAQLDITESGVYLAGHSAGAHLAAMLLAKQDDNVHNLKGAILMSGIYDLRPLVKTTINKSLGLNEDTAWEVSPLKFSGDIIKRCSANTKVMIVHGEYDSPAFYTQSQQFSQTLEAGNVETKYICVPGVDHFELVENLTRNDYSLNKDMMTFMGIA